VMIAPIAMGVMMPPRLPAALNRAPVTPMASFGAVSAITVQPSAPKTFAEKCGTHDGDDDRVYRGVVTKDDGGAEAEADCDRQLARHRQRSGAPQKPIGEEASGYAAEASANRRKCRDKPRLHPGNLAGPADCQALAGQFHLDLIDPGNQGEGRRKAA